MKTQTLFIFLAAVGLQVAIAASVSAVSEDVSRDDSDGVSAESVSELQKRDSDSKSVEDGHESDSDSVEDGDESDSDSKSVEDGHESDSDSVEDGDEADSEAKNVEDGDGMMGTQGTPSPTVQ
ncbi:clumping factor B-like isoform X6 [Conger conger]|uniref:clumping factor B-like isoform X6 n=1 Tax=Conger conger TaxID=82655 RepID=UPI002A5ABD6D|nr:clumping factor B-like isoform X6 [Conger conger]